MRSIASSTSLSGTMAFRRSSSTSEKSSLPISGSTSIGDLELDVLAFLELLEVDARLQGGLQPAILDRLGGAGVDRLLDGLAEQRLAVLLLQQADRHLARAEARHLRGPRHLGQALVDLGRQVAGGHDDLELPLQPFGREFRHLHRLHFHFRLVRAEGLEPPRLAAREPKSRVSTNSTTPARRQLHGAQHEPGPSGRAARAESRAS